jgi:hypothetical protein
MTMRTTDKIITFHRPFCLKGHRSRTDAVLGADQSCPVMALQRHSRGAV